MPLDPSVYFGQSVTPSDFKTFYRSGAGGWADSATTCRRGYRRLRKGLPADSAPRCTSRSSASASPPSGVVTKRNS